MEKTDDKKKENSREELAKILKKIKIIRDKKGYTNESMAMDLNMSTSAYNKMEQNKTTISLQRFIEIRNILDIPYSEFFDCNSKNIYNQDLKDNSIGHYEVQSLYQENLEITQKLINEKDLRIKEKDELNAYLKIELEKLRTEIQNLKEQLKK